RPPVRYVLPAPKLVIRKAALRTRRAPRRRAALTTLKVSAQTVCLRSPRTPTSQIPAVGSLEPHTIGTTAGNGCSAQVTHRLNLAAMCRFGHRATARSALALIKFLFRQIGAGGSLLAGFENGGGLICWLLGCSQIGLLTAVGLDVKEPRNREHFRKGEIYGYIRRARQKQKHNHHRSSGSGNRCDHLRL